MVVTSLDDRRAEPGAEPPEPTWVRQQQLLDERDAAEQEQAVGALIGACLLGALDHVGADDLKRWDVSDRREVRLAQLWPVFARGDTGLHGCGFEYAVDAAINGSSAIPAAVRNTVLTVVSGQVQLILRDLGVPTDGWAHGLRSVMYGVERRGRPDRMAELETALGEQALLWPQAGADPVRLLDVLPLATCPRPPVSMKAPRASAHPGLPDDLSCLWQTDLLLGGASVRPTKEVRAVVSNPPYAATAWVSASLRYPARKVTAGAGLHLGIETAFTASERKPLRALVREVHGMPVVTLPLDGAFIRAFNRANATLGTLMRHGLPRHLHPANVSSQRLERWGTWLGARRTQLVVDVARELLSPDPDLFTVGDHPAIEAVELVAGRPSEPSPRRRPLAPVPQRRAS